jgi:hypothetical protein
MAELFASLVIPLKSGIHARSSNLSWRRTMTTLPHARAFVYSTGTAAVMARKAQRGRERPDARGEAHRTLTSHAARKGRHFI